MRRGDPLAERLLEIYRRLFVAYGSQGWWPGGDDPFVVSVGAILTQSVSWKNVERALANLATAEALSPWAIVALADAELEALVRPSGYYTVKARRVRAFARMVVDEFTGDTAALLALPASELRAKLLATYGIGEETADDIIVYAAHKPSFIVDAYTIRLFHRLELAPDDAIALEVRSPARLYRVWQRFFMDHLPADASLFNEYHALIVRHGIIHCRKRDPSCGDCPLLDLCPTGRHRLQSKGVSESVSMAVPDTRSARARRSPGR